MDTDMESTPSDYLIQHIREALAADPNVGELGISVEIVDKTVYLRGVVATEQRRAAIDEVVSKLLPEWTVYNETEIEELSPPAAAENIE
jgi:osmotically-inducible protein OsmY